MTIGKWLLEARSDKTLVPFFSKRLEVTPRTLRNWRKAAQSGKISRIGRPRYPAQMREAAMSLVAIELERQGYPGWRPIAAALPELPIRLLQACVQSLKRAHRKRIRQVRKDNRISMDVLARETIWTMDGTQVGRAENGKAVEVQVIKDRGSLAYRAMRTGAPAVSSDVTRLFEHVKQAAGLPLVCSTDNGAIYCSQETREYFEREKIVHLRSLPRTPEHNGSAEIGIRDVKETTQLTGMAIESTAEKINRNRLFGSKSFKSPSQLDEELTVAYNKVSRDEFYERCMNRLCKVSRSTLSRKEKRRAEREVIFRTLEEYGLIQRTRGNRPYMSENAEIFL